MITFERIKEFYIKGFWNENMIVNAVKMNKITEEQYKDITKKDYLV